MAPGAMLYVRRSARGSLHTELPLSGFKLMDHVQDFPAQRHFDVNDLG